MQSLLMSASSNVIVADYVESTPVCHPCFNGPDLDPLIQCKTRFIHVWHYETFCAIAPWSMFMKRLDLGQPRVFGCARFKHVVLRIAVSANTDASSSLDFHMVVSLHSWEAS